MRHMEARDGRKVAVVLYIVLLVYVPTCLKPVS
jgi:hypothetical protein